MSDSVRPHWRQPTRLRHTWDSPGKNTGVGCHFFLQCMKVKSESEVAQSSPTLLDPMDCSLPGSSIHGIFQARVLEWDAIAFSCLRPRESQTLRVKLNHLCYNKPSRYYVAKAKVRQSPQRHGMPPLKLCNSFIKDDRLQVLWGA